MTVAETISPNPLDAAADLAAPIADPDHPACDTVRLRPARASSAGIVHGIEGSGGRSR